MNIRSTLLGSAAILSLFSPATAQTAQPPADQSAAEPAATQPAAAAAQQPDTSQAQPTDDYGEEDEIVIQGSRPRGSVVGDIPPENTLTSRDVRATGATNINELLDALAPQIGSAQGRSGGPPLILLNGQRVSSFRELRDIPTEAIERVDILPEEVALKYGYRADQKVVNIVLRQRFRSTTAQAGAGAATDGGYANGVADVTQFRVEKQGRTTYNLHAEGNNMLTENERDIMPSDTAPDGATTSDLLNARSLVPSKRDVRGAATFNREIFGDVAGTLNTEVEHVEGHGLIGLGEPSLERLGRDTGSDTAHVGGVLNGTKGNWRWTVTGNGDLQRDVTNTERDDPSTPSDRARSTTESGDLKATANGNLFSLPAGDASTTVTLAGSTVHLDSQHRIAGDTNSNALGRTTGEAAINLDLPISRRNKDFSALGNLTLNGNAEVDQLSDFGTLTTIGAGANWSPVDRLNFLGSWTREEGPPTINQLGDPLLVTPETRVFDFTTGQTVFVTEITGGNPNLESDRRNVLKLGANWQPIANTDFRLRADYVHQSIERPISNLTITPTMEEAFPERFVRNSAGQLVSVDLRPVNFDSSRKDTLRIGFDFSHPLKSRRPSQALIDQMRAQFRRSFGGGSSTPTTPSGGTSPTSPEGTPAPPPGQAGQPPEGGGGFGGFRGGFGGRGGGGGGGFFGGGNRGRLTLSVTDTITLVDKVSLGPDFPEIDYLHGDAAGQSGGTPRHQVEAQAGYFNNGLGARLGANWRSGTRVNALTADNLRFSPLATFDLRLFANPGDIPEVAVKHPWLRSTQLRVEVTNLFNARPQVHDAAGNIPLSYQPDLLDPLGRTIMISFRKLFLPSPTWFRRQFEERQQQQSR
jgi:hypothetical protein